MRHPLQQGLRLFHEDLILYGSPAQVRHPLQQGLRHVRYIPIGDVSIKAQVRRPLQQGLRHLYW